MNGKWNNEFGEVNLIKEIKLRSWLKASFYDTMTIGFGTSIAAANVILSAVTGDVP